MKKSVIIKNEQYEESVETFDKSVLNYQKKFMGMDLYNDTFDKFCKLIEKNNPDVFEIACGPGNITKYLLSIRPDFNVFGIDLAPKMIDVARINNPQANFDVMDCRDIGKLDQLFDGIMCGFCLPFLSKEDCDKLINDSYKLLNQKGVLYISTMEDDYNKSGFETTSFSGDNRVFIYYHQVEFISECLLKNGFDIIDLQRKDYPEADGTFLTDMIFMAKKK